VNIHNTKDLLAIHQR